MNWQKVIAKLNFEIVGLKLPVGDAKQGYRLPIQVYESSENDETSFAVAEVTVIQPNNEEIIEILEDAVTGIC